MVVRWSFVPDCILNETLQQIFSKSLLVRKFVLENSVHSKNIISVPGHVVETIMFIFHLNVLTYLGIWHMVFLKLYAIHFETRKMEKY